MRWMNSFTVRRTASLSRAERARAEQLGVYYIEANGFDRQELAMSSRTVAVCLNAAETAEKMLTAPNLAGWEDVDCKSVGLRTLSSMLESHRIDVAGARFLLERAASGEPHELLPAPLATTDRQLAETVQVYLIWYEDKFHYGADRDSFAMSICLSREEAESEYRKQNLSQAESGGDGYEIVGPSPLDRQPPEVVREVLLRLRTGMPGPVPIPSRHW